MDYIGNYGGIVIYLLQEGRGIGLGNKILVYDAQEREGLDTVEANRSLGFPDDMRTYNAVHDILKHFKISSINLMTNNQRKISELKKLGITISGRVPIHVKPSSVQCERYLYTKSTRMGHLIPSSDSIDVVDRGLVGVGMSAPIKAIRFYDADKEYGFLSNFYVSPMIVEEKSKSVVYKSVEHFYQSQKFVAHPHVQEKVLNAETPAEAFQISRQYADLKMPDWDSHKRHIMFKGVVAKFNNPALMEKLIETGNARLIESSKTDFYWGEGEDRSGFNVLGDLLMRIRSMCQQKIKK
eukprot:TRINITY_DN10396_c0_g1_i1.p1 TRINITY_DN10396_c0_g1~~TRINITY_DN10396_c0_g1_i1.p1  ORF type:complete len:327 (+),score=55.95 TRINITY_DN10396_c0_g1_i1:94-981(+)